MSTQEGVRVERDSGDITLEALLAGAPIADSIRAVEPSLMPEIAPHLLSEMILSLRVGSCTIDELNLVAKSLVSSLDELDGLRETARKRKATEPSPSLADFDY